ncbi:MAG: BrnA antitoxin family protein [Butyrivibrio sp.]|nr:BrnA antitoxin family protein [Butyrivibrio sp.]
MGTVRNTINVAAPLTKKQKAMLKKAESRPITYDKENPPLTSEELKQFHRVSDIIKEEREEKCKHNVTIRLSPETLKKARALGKGYTSILAKIIEKALDNPNITEQLMDN